MTLSSSFCVKGSGEMQWGLERLWGLRGFFSCGRAGVTNADGKDPVEKAQLEMHELEKIIHTARAREVMGSRIHMIRRHTFSIEQEGKEQDRCWHREICDLAVVRWGSSWPLASNHGEWERIGGLRRFHILSWPHISCVILANVVRFSEPVSSFEKWIIPWSVPVRTKGATGKM